ncbi:MAG: TonB-dependent receptor [Helicobacteraceae bacterium]|nr:TonB-dependent receptor [Candidatus Sulfurimonas ponti]
MQKNIQLSLVLVALTGSLYANSAIELEPITVTSATKTAQSIKDVTSNVNVITSTEIEEKNYTTVTEALNSVSGISFTSNGGLGKATSVMVRGFDSKRVLVLIDGVRYNDVTGISGAPFEHLMISDIEQIEIVKGAQSGVWGADATAGVINIITKDAKKGLHGFVSGEYGSFATTKYGASASYKEDSYYIKASSKKIDTNGFSAKAPKDEDIDNFEKDGYRNTTSNIKFGFNINETNKVDISHTIVNAHNEYDSGDANSYAASRTNDSFTSINFNHIDSFNELNVYVNKSKFDRNYSYGEYDGEVYEYGVKSNISYRENDFILVGIDYKTFEHENNLQEKYDNKAIFITNNNEFGFAGKTIVTESLRFDTYNKFENKTTGKLGIKNLNNSVEGLVLSANIGTAYNVPTLYNLFSPYGSTTITPEETLSCDLGIEYKNFKITYFKSVISDMIDFDMTTYKYNNLKGDSKIKGLELEYNKAIADDIVFGVNYTRLDARNNDSEVLARRAKQSLKASIDYYATTDLHIGLNGEYIGSRYNSDNLQGEQTGKYTVVNMVANYEINKNLSMYAKIDNLFDKYYQVVDGYATAPRSAYLGFKANF